MIPDVIDDLYYNNAIVLRGIKDNTVRDVAVSRIIALPYSLLKYQKSSASYPVRGNIFLTCLRAKKNSPLTDSFSLLVSALSG